LSYQPDLSQTAFSKKELGGVKKMENNDVKTMEAVVASIQAPYVNITEPVTMVVGCGGAGNNLVDYFHRLGVEGITTIGINTDEQHLGQIEADKKIFIGKTITMGRGSGGNMEVGCHAAELAKDSLREILKNSDIVFLVAGLGGGTGSGATPVVGQIAREIGAVVIGIGLLPFRVEKARTKKAESSLRELNRVAESTILLDNNKLLTIAPELTVEEGLNIMNKMVTKLIMNTRRTIVQAIAATKSLDIGEMVGEVQTGIITESEPAVNSIPNIAIPAPLHASIMNPSQDENGINKTQNQAAPEIIQENKRWT
jgi:cell division GTPase FtsZ